MIINQHPEWKIIEAWFEGRAKLSGKQLHAHVERIALDVVIDEVVEQAAKELGFRAGQQVSKILAD
jgi:hypothetical protein